MDKNCEICGHEFDGKGKVCEKCKKQIVRNRAEAHWWESHRDSEDAQYAVHIGKRGKVMPTVPE